MDKNGCKVIITIPMPPKLVGSDMCYYMLN